MTNTDREPVAWRYRNYFDYSTDGGYGDWVLTARAPAPLYRIVQALYAAPPPTAPTEIAVNRCQLCGGEIQGWMCQSCPATFSENEDGWLVLDPRSAPTPSEGEPFMWGAEWEGGCGRMFREAYRTEEDARREAEHLNGRAFPLFRHAASAPTVHEVARVLGPLMIGEAGQNETAARIIELFQGKA